MAAPTIPVPVEENLRDPIDIRVDIIHLEPVAAIAFPAATVETDIQEKEQKKRKPKASKSKHGMERTKSKVKPSEENTT
ncbi:hypothetical protein Tco_0604020 [Tanacetum coccineum]